MKKLITAAVMAAMLIQSAAYAAGDVYLNNRRIDERRSVDGIDMLAVRTLFESSGYTVQWFPEDNRVTAFDADTNITMYADKSYVFINQNGTGIDDSIKYCDGSLVMPLSAARLALDADIEYKDGDIYVTSENVNDESDWQYKVLELTNIARAWYNLPPLVWNASLAEAAQRHCDDMAQRNYFSHNTPEGLDPFARLNALGIGYSYAAENIAAGQPDPEAALLAWIQSDAHRANILNPNIREMGAAFSRGGTYGIYWAQEFATTK